MKKLSIGLCALLTAVAVAFVSNHVALAGKGGKPGGGGGGEDPPPPPREYVITVFDNLGGNHGTLERANKFGDAVGRSRLVDGSSTSHAIFVPVDADGVPIAMIDLNDVVDPSSGWVINDARDINESNQIAAWGTHPVVGERPLRVTLPPNDALVRQPDGSYRFEDADGNVLYAAIVNLGLLQGTFTGTAFGINNRGDVTGDCWLIDGGLVAFVYTDESGMTPIPVLGSDFRQALGINDDLQITGELSTGAFPEAHRYSFVDGGLQSLGTLEPSTSPQSTGWDINEAGWITGVSSFTVVQRRSGIDTRRAFRAKGGIMEDLGTLGGMLSEGHGINSAGDVVGFSATSSDKWGRTLASAAFLYSDTLGGGGMHNLNDMIINPTGEFVFPKSIADNGVIVGSVNSEDGAISRPFILTLIPSAP